MNRRSMFRLFGLNIAAAALAPVIAVQPVKSSEPLPESMPNGDFMALPLPEHTHAGPHTHSVAYCGYGAHQHPPFGAGPHSHPHRL